MLLAFLFGMGLFEGPGPGASLKRAAAAGFRNASGELHAGYAWRLGLALSLSASRSSRSRGVLRMIWSLPIAY